MYLLCNIKLLDISNSLSKEIQDLNEKIREAKDEMLKIENKIKQEELKLKTCSDEIKKGAELTHAGR